MVLSVSLRARTGKFPVVFPVFTTEYANTALSPGSSVALWPGWGTVPSGVTLTEHTACTTVTTVFDTARTGSVAAGGTNSACAWLVISVPAGVRAAPA